LTGKWVVTFRIYLLPFGAVCSLTKNCIGSFVSKKIVFAIKGVNYMGGYGKNFRAMNLKTSSN
jgi:hypothetical protein